MRHEAFFIEEGKGIMTLDSYRFTMHTKISDSVFLDFIASCIVNAIINAGKEVYELMRYGQRSFFYPLYSIILYLMQCNMFLKMINDDRGSCFNNLLLRFGGF